MKIDQIVCDRMRASLTYKRMPNEYHEKKTTAHTHTAVQQQHIIPIHAKSLINVNEWKVFAISNYTFTYSA